MLLKYINLPQFFPVGDQTMVVFFFFYANHGDLGKLNLPQVAINIPTKKDSYN
jgi:hypothetical protein